MRLRLSEDLDLLTVLAEGREITTMLGEEDENAVEVASFSDPVLLTDTAKIAREKPGMRDLLHSLYGSYPRVVEYNDVAVAWDPAKYPRVWCPSIDTVWMAREMQPYLEKIKSFAEIGTGSGYLTKFALHHAPQLVRAVATDINIDAIRCAQDNIGPDPRVSYVMPNTDANSIGISDRYDLVICNPPYIPRPNMKQDNPYEGLALIRKLADRTNKLLADDGRMLINISSVSGDEPLTWFSNIQLISERRVPLKVNVVTNGISQSSRDWMQYLRDKDLVEEEPNGDHLFWHRLRLYEVRRNS